MEYREQAKALEEDALRAQKILGQFDKMHDVTMFQGTIRDLKNVCIDKGCESIAMYAKASNEEQENVVVKTEPMREQVVSDKCKRKIEINLSEWESVILSGKGTVEFK